MLAMTLENVLETVDPFTPCVYELKTIDKDFNTLKTEYYNGNSILLRIADYQVDRIEMVKQYDDSIALVITVLELNGHDYYDN